MFVACLIYCAPSIEVSIFSTGRRASRKLLALIFKFLQILPGGEDMVIKYNEENMWLKGPYGKGDIRIVNSYPSKVNIEMISFILFFLYSYIIALLYPSKFSYLLTYLASIS